MYARFGHSLDHSLEYALPAIEIFTKPDFKERERIVTVLKVVA